MARLKPNQNVIKMTGFAIGVTYLGAFSLANYWGMTTEEVTRQYQIPFYVVMAIMIILFLQEEIHDQKKEEEEKLAKEEELKRRQEEQKAQVTSSTENLSRRKGRGRKSRKGKKR